MRRPSLLSATALTALLVLNGCREPKIKTYTAPKDPAPSITGAPAISANAGSSASSASDIRWQLPAGWTDQGANNIRLGNILVTDANGHRAEMTVTRFEGDVGGDLANVNRWRNQLGLAPIDEATLASAIAHRDFPAGHMDLVDLISDTPLPGSPEKIRTLVAWLKQPDATWFFKLSGADALVATQRDAFSAFLNSVDFAAPSALPSSSPSASGAPMSSQLPTGHPPIATEATASGAVSTSPAQPATTASPTVTGPMIAPSMSSMATSTLPAGALSSSNALAWTAPSSWTAKPLGSIRKGSFAVSDADLSVTAFPGDVGGLLANLNRWRGELQLAPFTQTDLPTATTPAPSADSSLRFMVVDFSGTPGGAPTRTLGAILPVGSDTWFFKLKGPDATVAAAKADFLAFLATVKTR